MDLAATIPGPVTREFLAVILAGFGNDLLPLSSDHGEEKCPKALLPIANKPMLSYILAWLEQSPIRDVLLICPASHRSAISHYIQSNTSSFPSLYVDLQPYDESPDLSVGTCTLLRHFSSRILNDFVIVPCDFTPPPSLPLSSLLNKFITDTVADGSIATACWFEVQRPEKGNIVDEWSHETSPVSIVWDESTDTLLHIDTLDDIDNNAENIELRMALLTQYPRTKLSSAFQDSHVYVCKRAVLDTLHQKQHFNSLREEFFPWLCKVQYHRAKREKYEHVLCPITNSRSQTMALRHSTLGPQPPAPSHRASKDPTLSVPTSPIDSSDDLKVSPSLRVSIIIHRSMAGFAARANNLHSYVESNRYFLVETASTVSTEAKSRSLVHQKAQISNDSVIGDSTQVAELTSIKKSAIGSHCIIGKMAKITGCIILDHCVVEDGAKLDHSVLGKSTKIGAGTKLTQCVTQAGSEINAGEILKNEKLEVTDWTLGSGKQGEEM